MEELESKLKSIPNSLQTSDIVKFVMDQPDFHEFGLGMKEKAS